MLIVKENDDWIIAGDLTMKTILQNGNVYIYVNETCRKDLREHAASPIVSNAKRWGKKTPGKECTRPGVGGDPSDGN